MEKPEAGNSADLDRLLDRAKDCLRRGDYVEAVRLSNRAVTSHPGTERVYRVRREMIRRFKAACRTPEGLSRVVRADPNLVWFYNERFEAQCCWGRFDEVLKELDKQIARDPRNARALALRGELLRMPAFCRFSDALVDLERAARLEPRSAWMRAFLGRARIYCGEKERGIRDLALSASLDPGCAWIRAWLGEGLWNSGRYREALRALDRAVDLDPECAVAHAWRGAARERLGSFASAVADLDAALALHHRYAEVYVWPSRSTRDWDELVRIDLYGLSLERGFVFYERARAKRALGLWDEAVSDMSQAILLDPKRRWFEGEGTRKEWSRLLSGLRLARARNPGRAWTSAWLGLALLRLGRPAEAVVELTRAVRRDSRNAWALAWRGEAFWARGDSAAALSDARRARRLDRACPSAHALEARILQSQGRGEAASKCLDRLLRADPRSAWAHCWKGELQLRSGHPRAAALSFDRALALHPSYADALFWRAEAYRLLGLLQKSLGDVESAIGLRSDHALSYVTRGLVLGKMGNARALVRDFKKARSLNPELLPSSA